MCILWVGLMLVFVFLSLVMKLECLWVGKKKLVWVYCELVVECEVSSFYVCDLFLLVGNVLLSIVLWCCSFCCVCWLIGRFIVVSCCRFVRLVCLIDVLVGFRCVCSWLMVFVGCGLLCRVVWVWLFLCCSVLGLCISDWILVLCFLVWNSVVELMVCVLLMIFENVLSSGCFWLELYR